MRTLLFDTDAFISVRRLHILEHLVAAPRDRWRLCMTSYIARHELSTLAGVIAELSRQELIQIHDVTIGSESGRLWRQLIKERIHKGEAEAIAWAHCRPREETVLFLSLDAGARKEAHNRRVEAIDVFDLVVLMIEDALLSVETASALLDLWNDNKQDPARPAGYVTFAESYAHHRFRTAPTRG